MITQPLSRTVSINQHLEIVANFLGDPAHLTEWTHFFKLLVKKEGATCFFETLVGPSETRIEKCIQESGRIDLEIVSLIKERIETASIKLIALDQDKVLVQFTLNVPADISRKQWLKMFNNLNDELLELKKLMQGAHA
jgi:hypothetical protein